MTKAWINPSLRFALGLVLGCGSIGCWVEATWCEEVSAPGHVAAPLKFPLEFQIVDPDSAKNKEVKRDEKQLPPLIVMFPGGKTDKNADAKGPIGRLEAFRGKSKLLPDSNDNPGLPVVLAGLRFIERKNDKGDVEGYEVELQGEFNAVKVPAPKDAMDDFLAGRKASFALESRLDYGIIATTSTTTLELQLSGKHLLIYSVTGDFSFREGFYTYKSPSLKTTAPKGREYLYYGVGGTLPNLRIL